MKTKTKTAEEKKMPKTKTTWVSKGGARTFVSRKEANIKKGKDKKERQKKPPQRVFSKKGLMNKKQRKNWNFEREDKRKTRKDNRKGRKKHFKTGLLGEQNRQKNSRIARKEPFLGLFTKQKHKNTGNKKQNHQKNKRTDHKINTFLYFGKQPLFLVNFCFFQVALFHVCKAVLGRKHYKNSVFSRAELLCITDSKAPFRGKTQNGTFATKIAILGLPSCLLKSLCL